MKYIVYATADHGNGFVQELGEYDDVDEIRIRVGMFSKDVLITVEQYWEKDKDEELIDNKKI